MWSGCDKRKSALLQGGERWTVILSERDRKMLCRSFRNSTRGTGEISDIFGLEENSIDAKKTRRSQYRSHVVRIFNSLQKQKNAPLKIGDFSHEGRWRQKL
jgi:hypothetical protein